MSVLARPCMWPVFTNERLELIEASLLFDVDPDDIDVTVHAQSIVHSMVTFTDGATIAVFCMPRSKSSVGRKRAEER